MEKGEWFDGYGIEWKKMIAGSILLLQMTSVIWRFVGEGGIKDGLVGAGKGCREEQIKEKWIWMAFGYIEEIRSYVEFKRKRLPY